MDNIPAITHKTLSILVDKIITAITTHESASVLNMTDREQLWRINDIINTPQMKNLSKDYLVLTINLSSVTLEEPEDFEKYILQQKKSHKYVVVFILNANRLLAEKSNLLSYLNSLPHRNPTYSFIFFFQRNILLPQYLRKQSNLSTLYQNILYYPHYEKEDQFQFISYLEKKFNKKLSESAHKEIFDQCGGYLWFLKQAFRIYTQSFKVDRLITFDEVKLKCEIMFNEFDPSEQELLIKLALNNKTLTKEEENIRNYFLKVNLIKKVKDKYEFTIPLLKEYIKKEYEKRQKLNLNEMQQITIGTVIMDNFFSNKERKLLKHFIANPSTILSRTKSASLIWGEENYSDWALDQFIRRLRKKFEKIGLSSSLITTVKNQGFVFINI